MLIHDIPTIDLTNGADFAVIESGFDILIEDEYPLLYMGKNPYGSWVIGSFIEEDDEDLTSLYYIQFILKKADYLDFVSKRISYKDIFILSKSAFILRKDLLSFSTDHIYMVDASTIPKDYFPHSKSFYPKTKSRTSNSLLYTISLDGGFADAFHALSNDSLTIQGAIGSILGSSINELPNISATAQVYQKASATGSFKLKFEVQINSNNKKGGDLFFNADLFSIYQNELIEYAIKHLPSEVDSLYTEGPAPEKFASLVETISEIYSRINRRVDSDKLTDSIKGIVRTVAEKMVEASASVGQNYSSLEFMISGDDNATEETLGSVTAESKNSLQEAVNTIERLTEEPDHSEVDTSHQKYKVYIHNLNMESRKGSGYIFHEDGTVSKPLISIDKGFALENTKFSESIATHSVIDVVAIGTKKDNRVTRLKIES